MGGGCDTDQACGGATGGGAAIMGGGGAGIQGYSVAPQPVLDPACMMGLALANDCSGWGAVIGNSWREGVYPACPADDDTPCHGDVTRCHGDVTRCHGDVTQRDSI